MSTKITNKQVKIISNVDFNEKEIENAIIDAEKNDITNLDIPTKVSDLENDSGYTTVADVNSEIIANSNSIDDELNEKSYNAVTNNAIVKGIDENKVSAVDDIVDTLPSGTLSIGQSVLDTTTKKIYKTVNEPEISSALNVVGTLTLNTDGTITGFSDNNYLYSIDGQGSGVGGAWSGFTISKFMFELADARYNSTTTIFSLIRRDDSSVLFGIDFYNRGFGGGTLTFYTKKRDGTVVDTVTVNASPGIIYEFIQTKSNYIKLKTSGKTVLIKYFGSLNASDNVEDDFYYAIPANIKISSKRVFSGGISYLLGISKLYGFESYIEYQYQGSPSSFNIAYAYSGNPIIWDEGTLIEKNKLLCNATTNILYRYNGNELEEISPNLEDYQKKLTAGDNIAISGEGYLGFSDINYLKFINNIAEPIPRIARDFLIKFKLTGINRNNTLLYSAYDTNKYCLLEITNENKLRCTYINSSGILRTENGTHVFQANKEYWIMVTTDYYPQFIYFLEDNGYTINSLPTDISAWTFDIESSYLEYMLFVNIESSLYLGYNNDATNNFLKGSISECRIKNSGGHIIFTLSEAVESSSFINNGCLKGPVISAIVPEIDSQLSDVSENPVQNKVIDAALKAMKPVIVTDSGTTLPSASGYQLNDTFLNTSAVRIFKVVEGYELNTNVTSTVYEVNLFTGVATGFGYNKDVIKTSSNFLWAGNTEMKVHFKQSTVPTSGRRSIFYSLTTDGTDSRYACVFLYKKELHFGLLFYNAQEERVVAYKDTQIISSISSNTEYYVKITKTGTSGKAELFTEGFDTTPIASVDFETEDYVVSGQTTSTLQFMCEANGFFMAENTYLTAYLLDCTGDFLVPSTSLGWDSGTSLVAGTEYADKTNGILYLYQGAMTFVQIGGGSGALAKKVYKFNSDNITTLDVSSDFTTVIDVLKNGIEIYENDDYTISNGIITFITPLSIADKICVKGEE